jgi:hypothetical protein
MSSMEKSEVAAASRTDHMERARWEIKPARGMVSDPTMGTKIVSKMMVLI